MSIREKQEEALRLLSDDAKLALSEWLKALSEAYMNDPLYRMPSYTDPECGAEHALEDVIETILNG